MNRKKSSLFFMPLLVIFSLVVLINLYIVLLSKNAPILDNPIGKRQFDLLKTYMRAESALFYIDQSAKYALQQSVYELGKDGGLIEVPASEVLISKEEVYIPPASIEKCGKFYGYSLWYEKDSICYDENKINVNLIFLLNKNLNQYLINYPTNIPINNYNYEIRDSLEIIGKSMELLKFDILKDEKKPAEKQSTAIKIPEISGNFVDFTDTAICAKGKKCVLTEEAFKKLEKAQLRAQEFDVSLQVTDGYRSREEQIAIWEGRTPDNYKLHYPNEEDRKKVVCYPYGDDVKQTCPHLTGDSVDIFFKGKNKQTMTIDDYKLLHRIMTQVKIGDNPDDYWVRYSRDPWHFECCGTIRYAKAKELEKKTGQPVTVIG